MEGRLGVQELEEDGWLALVFLCRHVSGTPESDGGYETDDAGYFSLEEMDGLQDPIEVWCDWLIRRVFMGQHHLIPPEEENPYRPKTAFL